MGAPPPPSPSSSRFKPPSPLQVPTFASPSSLNPPPPPPPPSLSVCLSLSLSVSPSLSVLSWMSSYVMLSLPFSSDDNHAQPDASLTPPLSLKRAYTRAHTHTLTQKWQTRARTCHTDDAERFVTIEKVKRKRAQMGGFMGERHIERLTLM